MRLFLFLTVAITCAGCAAQIAAEDDAQCKGYGAKKGSAAYVNCRAQLDASRAQAAAIRNSVPAEPYHSPIDTNSPPLWVTHPINRVP
jgi:hypothetical protein